ncbi:MAG: hypothetical protein N5P05_000404 [Chroococcopsis gigantea SAG 12.99]|nr:hypothetical protein [Chroococcopsis gigantea SAG 12.99]
MVAMAEPVTVAPSVARRRDGVGGDISRVGEPAAASAVVAAVASCSRVVMAASAAVVVAAVAQ